MSEDPRTTLIGPSAYTIYPITYQQERPYPGPSVDNMVVRNEATDSLDGY
jgi:hypothetical protein